jgi:hypothetical protein
VRSRASSFQGASYLTATPMCQETWTATTSRSEDSNVDVSVSTRGRRRDAAATDEGCRAEDNAGGQLAQTHGRLPIRAYAECQAGGQLRRC